MGPTYHGPPCRTRGLRSPPESHVPPLPAQDRRRPRARPELRGAAQRPADCGRRGGRGADPRGRRGGLGQDADPHLARRAAPRRRRRARVDPAPHVHQQGGARDAPPRGGGLPRRHPPAHRRHLPPRRAPGAARARRGARLPEGLLDPRSRGRARRDGGGHRRLRPRGRGPALPEGGRAHRPGLDGGEHADAARRRARDAAARSSRRSSTTCCASLAATPSGSTR